VKEIIIPRQSNSLLFVIGPCITLIFALLGWAIIPFGEGLTIFDYELGVFFALAVSSIGSYGILISGWAANSKYAFMGAIRSTAQLLSYELVFSSIILILIIFSGSFSLTYIVECQQAVWNIFPLLPIALMFFIAILAETNRPPFDLPEAVFGHLKESPEIYGWFFYLKFTICLEALYYKYFLYVNEILNKVISKNYIYLLSYALSLINIKDFQRLNVNIISVTYSNYWLFNIYFTKIKSFSTNNNMYNEISEINFHFSQNLKIYIKPLIPKKYMIIFRIYLQWKKIEIELSKSKGIYGFLCKKDSKIYLGSS
jgi:hypothetical protein